MWSHYIAALQGQMLILPGSYPALCCLQFSLWKTYNVMLNTFLIGLQLHFQTHFKLDVAVASYQSPTDMLVSKLCSEQG